MLLVALLLAIALAYAGQSAVAVLAISPRAMQLTVGGLKATQALCTALIAVQLRFLSQKQP